MGKRGHRHPTCSPARRQCAACSPKTASASSYVILVIPHICVVRRPSSGRALLSSFRHGTANFTPQLRHYRKKNQERDSPNHHRQPATDNFFSFRIPPPRIASRESGKPAVGGSRSPKMKVTFKVCTLAGRCLPDGLPTPGRPVLAGPSHSAGRWTRMLNLVFSVSGSQAAEIHDRCRADRSRRLPLLQASLRRPTSAAPSASVALSAPTTPRMGLCHRRFQLCLVLPSSTLTSLRSLL